MTSSIAYLAFSFGVGLARTFFCSGILGVGSNFENRPRVNALVKWIIPAPFYFATLVIWSAAVSTGVDGGYPATTFGFWVLSLLAWVDVLLLFLKIYKTDESLSRGGTARVTPGFGGILDPVDAARRVARADLEEPLVSQTPRPVEMRRKLLMCFGVVLEMKPIEGPKHPPPLQANAFNFFASLPLSRLLAIIFGYVALFAFLVELLLACALVAPPSSAGRAVGDVCTMAFVLTTIAMMWDTALKFKLVQITRRVSTSCRPDALLGAQLKMWTDIGVLVSLTVAQTALAFAAFATPVALMYAACAVWCPFLVLPLFFPVEKLREIFSGKVKRRYERLKGVVALIWPLWWESKIVWEGSWWLVYFALAMWRPVALGVSTVPSAGEAYGATLGFSVVALVLSFVAAAAVATHVFSS